VNEYQVKSLLRTAMLFGIVIGFIIIYSIYQFIINRNSTKCEEAMNLMQKRLDYELIYRWGFPE